MGSPCTAKTLARMDWELTKHGLAMRRKRDEYESRVAREGAIKNSKMYADDAFADDVITSDDVGFYYSKATVIESGLGNYEGGMDK